jgi:hypothetical protein
MKVLGGEFIALPNAIEEFKQLYDQLDSGVTLS